MNDAEMSLKRSYTSFISELGYVSLCHKVKTLRCRWNIFHRGHWSCLAKNKVMLIHVVRCRRHSDVTERRYIAYFLSSGFDYVHVIWYKWRWYVAKTDVYLVNLRVRLRWLISKGRRWDVTKSDHIPCYLRVRLSHLMPWGIEEVDMSFKNIS